MSERGIFITFEGSEGCGKSTQIARLEDRLRDRGIEILRTREPGGTTVGEHVRRLLQHTPEVENMTPVAELFLFAASRAQLVREKIEPALESGKWVIADRFFDSTTVYQGIGRGLGVKEVTAINSFAVGEIVPEVTFLLDMDAAEGHRRAVENAGGGPDRMEDQPMEFFESVRNGYLELAEREPERIAVIDASRSIDEVAEAIWSECEARLDLDS